MADFFLGFYINLCFYTLSVQEEDLDWVDVIPAGGATGREAGGRPEPEPRLGRNSPLRDTGRTQGGRGKRGFWARKREKQMGTKVKRVKWAEKGQEEDAETETRHQIDPAQTLANELEGSQD